MALIMSKMSSRGQVAYAQAGNVVEQTIGAIRTVKTQNNYPNLSTCFCIKRANLI